jgi:plastocyanin
MRARSTIRLPLSFLVCLLVAPTAAPQSGEVRGRVVLALPEIALASVGPIAIYLEPLERAAAQRTDARSAQIHQRDAAFQPGFSIATAGDEVELLNDDEIFHNVFSFSEPNAFDLGLYPKGEKRSVRLRHPGEVNIYCSIHESMSATILVVPTRYHAQVEADGAFRIRDVPRGRYRLHTWNATLPALAREIEVGPGTGPPLELSLGKPE